MNPSKPRILPAAHAAQAAPSRRGRRPRLALSLLGALALLVTAGVPAQAQTWAGLGVTNNWNDPLNWQGLTAPVSSSATAITFAGTRRPDTVQNIASPFTLNALSFASGAAAFTVSGQALRFTGSSSSLVQNSANAATLAVPIQIVQELVVSGSGSVSIKGPLSTSNADPDFRARLIKRGSGRLTLTEPSSFNGHVLVEQGRLRLENTLALQSADVQLLVDHGLDLSGVATVTLGGLSGSGALDLGSTRLTVGGNHGSPGLYSGAISATTGTLTKVGRGFTELSGSSSLAQIHIDEGGIVMRGGTTTLSDAGQGLQVGAGEAALPGRLATLDLRSGTRLSATGNTVQVDGAASTLLRVLDGSQLETGFQMLVGNHRNGILVVDSGGRVTAGLYLAMGFNDGSTGLLDLRSGSSVSSPVGLLGVLAGADGNAIVQGRWDNTQLGLGGFSDSLRGGTGSLFVMPGGVVTASDRVSFWSATSGVFIDGGQLRAGRLESLGEVGSITLRADGVDGAALLIEGASGTARFAGQIAGAGSLHKRGAVVQTLAGANSFSGSTTIEGGRIVLGHALALQNSTVVLQLDGGLDLGGLAEARIGNLAGNGTLDLGRTALHIGGNGQSAVYGGRLSGEDAAGPGSPGGALVKVGSGTSTLTGSGSSFNNLRVDDGTLRLVAASVQLKSATRDGSAALIVGGGARLEVLDGARLSPDAAGDSSVFIDGPAGTQLLVDGAGSRLDTGFQLIVGNAAQGELTVRNGGEVTGRFALVAGFGAGSSGSLTLESGGRASAPLVGVGGLAGSSGSVHVRGAGSSLQATSELGVGGVSASQSGGQGLLTLRDGGVASAPRTVLWNDGSRVRVDGGQLRTGALLGTAAGSEIELLADAAGGAALVLDSAAGVHRYAGRISGAGGVQKLGAGTQVLEGSNRFGGAVRVAAGTLEMASSAASEYEVQGGAQLRLGERHLGAALVHALPGASVVYTAPLLTGGQLLGAGMHDVGAVQRIVGTQIANGVLLQPAHGATLVGVGNHGRVFNAAGHSLSWTGGGNPLGTLTVAGSTQIGAFSSGGLIEVLPGGTLVNTGTDLLLGGGSRTLIGSAAAPGGTLRLPDASRVMLSGGLLVNNGTLDGALHVQYGALAKGAGSFGAVTVADGGRFSPGNSPGTAHSSSATWAAGGSYVVELAAAAGTAGEHWDLWRIDGLLDITAGTSGNSRFTLSLQTLDAAGAPGALAGFDPLQAWQWLIVDTDGGIAGFDPARLALDTSGFGSATAGGSFMLALHDGDLFLQFAPVPEPGTWAQLLGGLAGLGWLAARRGRRR